MLPKAPQTARGDLFKSESAAIIDLNHPLARIDETIDWERFEKTLHPTYVTDCGAPAINTRLMVSLHILKFQHGIGDQAVMERWMENQHWQFFSGMRFFSHSLTLDPSCCRLAALFDVPLVRAAQNAVPVGITAGDRIERSPEWTSGRCLSADRAGLCSRWEVSGRGRGKLVKRESVSP
jgi:hypothetical protein